MKTGAIIAARMTSQRFPGKLMADCQGKPVLQHVIERCKASTVDEVIVATPSCDGSKNPNRQLKDLAAEMAVHHFEAWDPITEDNVLERVIKAAERYEVECIIRVNGDCPLVDPALINELIGQDMHQRQQGHVRDYIGYRFGTLPAVLTRYGAPELVTLPMLRRLQLYQEAIQEHVTYGCHSQAPCSSHWIQLDHGLMSEQNTVDLPEDLERICERLAVGC